MESDKRQRDKETELPHKKNVLDTTTWTETANVIEAAKLLWLTLPDEVHLVVDSGEDVCTLYPCCGTLHGKKSPIVSSVEYFLKSIGKCVHIDQIPREHIRSLYLRAHSTELFIHDKDNKSEDGIITRQDRFDDSKVYLAMTTPPQGMSMRNWEKSKKEHGLIGSISAGLIRNFYFLGSDGFPVDQSGSALQYARSLSVNDKLARTIRGFVQISKRPFAEIFEEIIEQLKTVQSYEQVVIVLDRFNDHERNWGGDNASEMLQKHFPDATLIKINEIGYSNYAYDNYPLHLEQVRQITRLYNDDKKTLFLYDRHAYGLFNGVEESGIWYYEPRSTGTNTILQLPVENLFGSINSKNNTPEASELFQKAGLQNEFSQEEVDTIVAQYLLGVATWWHRERNPDSTEQPVQ